MSLATETVLVTGASGFIGSALVQYLIDAQVPVIPTARGRTDILSDCFGIKVLPLDVMGDLTLRNEEFDAATTLVHCATPNDIQSKGEDGGLSLATHGTYRLIEHAAAHGIRRIVYLSTLQVYGTELEGAIDETTPVHCETAYGLNHYLGEEVCRLAVRRHGIDVVALRPSNVYGVPSVPTVARETLVPMCFVRDAKASGAVELRSSGHQQRNFVSTGEVAEIIATLIADFPSEYTIVNAVSAYMASIRQIADMTEDVWNRVSDTPLQLRVLSDEPAEGNAFTLTSKIVAPRLSEDQSRQRMADTIERLIQRNQETRE
tara:strand:+ start:33708 stop:34661 length:954 start_codon:yes stop_codon:yes gene_type:complete